jgi:hypothetical protein
VSFVEDVARRGECVLELVEESVLELFEVSGTCVLLEGLPRSWWGFPGICAPDSRNFKNRISSACGLVLLVGKHMICLLARRLMWHHGGSSRFKLSTMSPTFWHPFTGLSILRLCIGNGHGIIFIPTWAWNVCL